MVWRRSRDVVEGISLSIRVGFLMTGGGGSLLGATNYLRSITKAAMASEGVTPVVIAAGALPAAIFDGSEGPEVVRSPFAGLTGPHNFLRRGLRQIIGRDFALEAVFRRHGIDVLSHSGPFRPGRLMAATPWIPDFQHLRLPGFFSADELRQRDAYFQRTAIDSSLVVVSSHAARRDFETFFPKHGTKARVLPFPAMEPPAFSHHRSREALATAYGIRGPYFFLPNHFWIHKNHEVVVKALALARSRGRPMQVVASGHTADRRHPNHFAELKGLARRLGVDDDFLTVGVIPYGDVMALLHHAAALINPSLFEGWSTPVEEARSLGKRAVLSKIDVHLEQDIPGAVYFDPMDAEDLLQKMQMAQEGEVLPTKARQAALLAEHGQRTLAFRHGYASILREAAQMRGVGSAP
jgi:glycosyltransferase involved in cell wall biosynthesis